jgi:hypothetical protein
MNPSQEEREAAEVYQRKQLIKEAYRKARSAGGPIAEILNEVERLPPGSVGCNAQIAREKRERRRNRRYR